VLKIALGLAVAWYLWQEVLDFKKARAVAKEYWSGKKQNGESEREEDAKAEADGAGDGGSDGDDDDENDGNEAGRHRTRSRSVFDVARRTVHMAAKPAKTMTRRSAAHLKDAVAWWRLRLIRSSFDEYFKDAWNVMDLCVILLVVWWGLLTHDGQQRLLKLRYQPDTQRFVDLQYALRPLMEARNVGSMSLVIAWLKVV